MLSTRDSKEEILKLLSKAESLIPAKIEKDLPPIDKHPNVPKWHAYELEIWKLGEEIRQILITHKSLRKDKLLLDSLLKICLNKNAKRGRQPFILLFSYKHCINYAAELSTQLKDEFVSGQVIETLLKMHANGFAKKINEISNDKTPTWIKKLAIKYTTKFE